MEWILSELDRQNRTQRELAAAIGMAESTMSKCLHGGRQLKAGEADAIRRFFGYQLPDDPKPDLDAKIERQIATLDDEQKRAVALYLEALSGIRPVPRKAS